MLAKSETQKHRQIKTEIVTACANLGYQTVEEYRGKGWRADVFAITDSENVAFEVQLSSQSLKKTLERQERYFKDGVKGCWLFERPIPKLLSERPDLPLFYVSTQLADVLTVSLSDRKNLPLRIFVEQFLKGKIRFCEIARTKLEQTVKIVFFEMPCWKCKAINHIYYVDTSFRAACNAIIRPDEYMWSSDRQEFTPEIIKAAKDFTETEQGQMLHLGEIKLRYSKSVDDSYVSFGCYKCDSIFGDYFVREAEMEAMYGYGQVVTIESTIKLQDTITLPLQHWCYPESYAFCDETQPNF